MSQKVFQIRTIVTNPISKILVTGGAGFIGSHLVEHLLLSHPFSEIVVLDDLTYAASDKALAILRASRRVNFIKGNICDRLAVKRAMEGIDRVYHLAAETHVPNSFVNPDLFIETNVGGTKCLLAAAKGAGIGRFIHVSTDEVYGATQTCADENHGFFPTTPYAHSKVEAEKAVFQARAQGLDAIIVRPTNAIGLRQHEEKLVPRFIRRTYQDQPLTIEGDGLQKRCFIPAPDLAKAIWTAAQAGNPNDIYNIPGREELSVLEVAQIIRSELKRDTGLSFVADRQINDCSYRISGERISQIGFEQQSSVRVEIKRIADDMFEDIGLIFDRMDSAAPFEFTRWA